MAAVPINLVIEVNLPGQPEDGSNVRFARLKCGNTIAQVSGAGFLDAWVKSQGLAIYVSDVFTCACSDGVIQRRPSIGAGGVITLVALNA